MSARVWLVRLGNRFGVWLYRRSNGRIAGPSKGMSIGLLTVPGRSSGVPRTVEIGFHPHEVGYLVAGSGSGSKQEPQWFRNLRHADRAQVQLGASRLTVDVTVPNDAEQQRLWQEVVLAQAPWRARYERKAGRPIPVAILSPRRAPA